MGGLNLEPRLITITVVTTATVDTNQKKLVRLNLLLHDCTILIKISIAPRCDKPVIDTKIARENIDDRTKSTYHKTIISWIACAKAYTFYSLIQFFLRHSLLQHDETLS